LACAALLPEHVNRTAVLVSVAPADAAGLDWFGGMTDANISEYAAADNDTPMLTERLRFRADSIARDPENLVNVLREQMTDPDKRVVNDVALRRILADTHAAALRDGPEGWVDDVLALRRDWGFRLDEVKGPVRLWHGADDNFAPVSHTRWLAGRIPGAEIQVQSGAAHFGAMEILPDMLGWLVARSAGLVGAQGRPSA
ncbi:MAG: alpha/beta fold hydrolase, partial [Gemmatimonadales bacterium]